MKKTETVRLQGWHKTLQDVYLRDGKRVACGVETKEGMIYVSCGHEGTLSSSDDEKIICKACGSNENFLKAVHKHAHESLIADSIPTGHKETPPLGEGAFGIVSDWTMKDTFVIKQLKTKRDLVKDGRRIPLFIREVCTMKTLEHGRASPHPNIARCYFPDLHANAFLLLKSTASLEDVIKKNNAKFPSPFTNVDTRALLVNAIYDTIGSAIRYMHSLDIIHADIKPANLLVRFRGATLEEVTLSDYGLSFVAKHSILPWASPDLICTHTYKDLELLALSQRDYLRTMEKEILSPVRTDIDRGSLLEKLKPASPSKTLWKLDLKKSDLWAFGITLLELMRMQQVVAPWFDRKKNKMDDYFPKLIKAVKEELDDKTGLFVINRRIDEKGLWDFRRDADVLLKKRIAALLDVDRKNRTWVEVPKEEEMSASSSSFDMKFSRTSPDLQVYWEFPLKAGLQYETWQEFSAYIKRQVYSVVVNRVFALVEKDFGDINALYPSIATYDSTKSFTNRFILAFDDGEQALKEQLKSATTLIEKMGLDAPTFKFSTLLSIQAKVDLNKQCIELALRSIDMIERYLSHERFIRKDIPSVIVDLKREEERQLGIFQRANRVDDYRFNFTDLETKILSKNKEYQEGIVNRFSLLAEVCYVIQRLMIAPRFIEQQSAFFAEVENIALARTLLDQFEYVVLPKSVEPLIFLHASSQTYDGFKVFMRDFRSKAPVSYEAWRQELLTYLREEREGGQGKRKKINSHHHSVSPCQK